MCLKTASIYPSTSSLSMIARRSPSLLLRPFGLPNAYAANWFSGEAAPPANSTAPHPMRSPPPSAAAVAIAAKADGEVVTEKASSSNDMNSAPTNVLAQTAAIQNKRKCTLVEAGFKLACVDICNNLSVFHVSPTQDMRPPGVRGQGAAPGIIGPPPIGTPRDPIA